MRNTICHAACFKDLNFVDCFFYYYYVKNSIEKKVKGVFPNSLCGRKGRKKKSWHLAQPGKREREERLRGH